LKRGEEGDFRKREGKERNEGGGGSKLILDDEKGAHTARALPVIYP